MHVVPRGVAAAGDKRCFINSSDVQKKKTLERMTNRHTDRRRDTCERGRERAESRARVTERAIASFKFPSAHLS